MLDLFKEGEFNLSTHSVLILNGDFDTVKELLQGQVTSDVNICKEGSYQLSSICNEKGFVIADFILTIKNNVFHVVIHESLIKKFKQEIEQFLPFYKTEIGLSDMKVIGYAKNRSINGLNPYLSAINTKQNLYIEIVVNDKENKQSFIDNHSQWIINNYCLDNIGLDEENSGKFRPHELGYDKTRISFSKGCFRGQEIIARVKYRSKKSHKLKLNIVSVNKFNKELKILGQKIEYKNHLVFFTSG